MAWTNPNSVHIPTTGNVIPASWGAMVNQNLMHLRHSPETAGATRNTTQTINHDTITAVSFTIEMWDNANMWRSPYPTRFWAPVDGRYLFTAFVTFQANAAGQRMLYLRYSRDGGGMFGIQRQDAATSGTTVLCCTGIMGLRTDDYVEVFVDQTSGGPLNVNDARAVLIRLGG